MYATLGDIEFSNLLGPSSFSGKDEANYAQHDVILNKPRLQKMGDQLEEIQLGMLLHNSFCEPAQVLRQLREYTRTGTIVPLIYGTGEVAGEYVVCSIEREQKQTSPNGELVELQLTVKLKEFFDPDKLGSKELAAKAAAFAFQEIKPLPTQFIPQASNPVNLVMGDVVEVGSATAEINRTVDLLNKGLTTVQRAQATIARLSQKAAQGSANIQSRVSQYQALSQSAQQLPAKANALNNTALQMGALMPITSIDDVTSVNGQMQTGIQELNAAAAPLAVLAALRTVVE